MNGRQLIESKLRRRSILLAGNSEKKKKKKEKFAGGRRKERRAAEWTARREREAELKTWAETRHLREAWRTYATNSTEPFDRLDLHGAVLAVVASDIESYVGVCGMVVEETQQTFRILERSRHKVKHVPKRKLIFALVLHGEDGEDDIALDNERAAVLLEGQPFIDRWIKISK